MTAKAAAPIRQRTTKQILCITHLITIMKRNHLSLMCRSLLVPALFCLCLCSCMKLEVKDSIRAKSLTESVTLDSQEKSSKTLWVEVKGTGWEASVAEGCDFLSVSPDRGDDSGIFTITATSSNTTAADRTGTIIVKSTAHDNYGNPELSQAIKVTQECAEQERAEQERAEGVYLSLTCPSDAPQHGDFVVLYQPKNGEEWERTLTTNDYTISPDDNKKYHIIFTSQLVQN